MTRPDYPNDWKPPGGKSYVRTVKLGKGVTKPEKEEEPPIVYTDEVFRLQSKMTNDWGLFKIRIPGSWRPELVSVPESDK